MPVRLEEKIGVLLRECGKKISVAESCTGGLVCHWITEVAGSSDYFERGVVSYSNRSKVSLLNVSPHTLERFGAVSPETAEEMARGIRQVSGADLGVSTTGIAGPGGGSKEKPVGLVYVGLSAGDETVCRRFVFRGSRQEIKIGASEAALRIAVDCLLSIARGAKPQE